MILTAIMMSTSTTYASQEKCEELNYQAVEQSLTEVCGDNSQEALNSCQRDGDFYVLMQELTYELRSELVDSYNQENPNSQISCDDFDYENDY